MNTILEYIWLDGSEPTQKLRSKIKVLDKRIVSLEDIPEWGFDGSSTEQATGDKSDCILKPVNCFESSINFIDGKPHNTTETSFLVLCEVFNSDGTPHATNKRYLLREAMKKCDDSYEAWFGIEQEYTLLQNKTPLGFPENGLPMPQGPYYCGVGAENVFGRPIALQHMNSCLDSKIKISGINGEVMPGQWEFQIGPLDAITVSDQLWIARYILQRIGEDHGVTVSLDPKPVKGDWNGAGAHTNFSTKDMREEGGMEHILEACEKLAAKHEEHIVVYGHDNEERLTGLHETCSIKEFRYGVSDRGASIRIPLAVANDGCGYLEDRRPAANIDPYEVCAALILTVYGEK